MMGLRQKSQHRQVADPRLFPIDGQRDGSTINRDAHVFETRTFCYYQIISARSASVSELVPKVYEDRQNRSVSDDEFGIETVLKLNCFTHSDSLSDDSEDEESSTSEIRAFLDTIYDLVKRGKEDYAIDVIFEYMNNLLIDGQFDACDLILAEVALAKIPPVLMVSFLTISAAAKSKLRNRDTFFKIARRMVAKQRGEKAADRLLDGLD